MYKIIGADRKEYGPISADQVREWIAQRRADGRTLIQPIEATDWKPLAQLSEFAAALAASPSRPPVPTPPSPTVPPSGPLPITGAEPTTNGLAIASLVLGLLGFCGIPAVIGLVCGIVARRQIRRSQGRQKGSGLALAGILISAVMLAGVVLATIAFVAEQSRHAQNWQPGSQPRSVPADQGGRVRAAPPVASGPRRQQPATADASRENLVRLQQAVTALGSQQGNRYPAATNWCDALLPLLGDPKLLQRPGDPTGGRSGYGFNASLSGRAASSLRRPVVLFFELQKGGWNVSGGPELMRFPEWEGERIAVALTDGSVRQLPAGQLNTLRWEP